MEYITIYLILLFFISLHTANYISSNSPMMVMTTTTIPCHMLWWWGGGWQQWQWSPVIYLMHLDFYMQIPSIVFFFKLSSDKKFIRYCYMNSLAQTAVSPVLTSCSDMDGLVQERRNSIANALELHFPALTHQYALREAPPWVSITETLSVMWLSCWSRWSRASWWSLPSINTSFW